MIIDIIAVIDLLHILIFFIGLLIETIYTALSTLSFTS